jgi:alcohol dehydrogenase (cytochrome c)
VASLLSATGAGVVSAQSAAGNVSSACLLTESCDGSIGWPSANGPVTGGRYSVAAQINTSNVQGLKLAWTFKSGVPDGTEDYPVVIGDVAYITTTFGDVYALSATTGKEIWEYQPPASAAKLDHGAPNRGVAVGNGSVYVLANTDQLIRLNAATGKLVWAQLVVPNAIKDGYSESVAPVYYDGVVYVGSAGGDSGVRGFIEAMNANTGALLWRFWTVPKDGTSWLKAPGDHGGGTTWGIPTLDPAANRIFFGTGNPSPDFYAGDRPGLNPYTDSIMAITMNDGTFVWAYDEVPHDMWDYDAPASPTMFPAQGMQALGAGGKDGIWYEVDAKTGQLITMPLALVKEDHSTPPTSGNPVEEWPGSGDGFEWSAAAYDPQTGLAYTETISGPTPERAYPKVAAEHKVGELDVATTFLSKPADIPVTGAVTAISADNGTVTWQQKTTDGVLGGATATAGGLVFAALSGTGQLEALDAANGKVLWSFQSHQAVGAGPSVYTVDGHEYVLYALGGSAFLAGPGDMGGLRASDGTYEAFELK